MSTWNDVGGTSRILTLLFTDLADSTALKTQRGDQAVGELITRHREHVRRLAVESGGRIIDWAGDGCFLTFETPSAAVLFALRLQQAHCEEPDLPGMRIGIHMGEVSERPGPEGDVAHPRVEGLAVDLAARISGLARPAQVLMSSSVADSARQRLDSNAFGQPIRWRTHGSYALKGFDEALEIREAGLEDVAPFEAPAASEKATPTRPSGSTATGRRPLRVGVMAAVVSVAIAVLVWWTTSFFWKSFETVKVAVPTSTVNATPANASALSIAVLPFANRTGNPQDEYVADGITESLTTDLSRIQQAFIVNASTAFTYKDKPVMAQQVGKDLGVRFVLQGSVQRSGSKIRINAQLADTTSNAQLWAESFEGDQSNLFALQDHVTTRIANSIGREMVILAARESETRKSSPKVVDLTLRARALSLKPQSLKNWQQIEALYREVLVLEPNNSSAMAAIAMCLALQAANFNSALGEKATEQKYVEGRDLALKAKELDPGNPSIYLAVGFYALAHDDFAGSRRAFETRVSLQPKNPGALNTLAVSFNIGGEPRRVIELLTQAINLDPKHATEAFFRNMCLAYFMLGDNDAAIEWCLKSLELNPAFPHTYPPLAMAYALKGDDARARATVDDLRRVDPSYGLSKIRRPPSSSPAASKEFFEKKFVPAWRKAGLPE